MNQSPTIGSLASALSKAQASFKPAVKDAANPFFKSHYLSLAGAIEACREALSVNGLAVVQAVDSSGEKLVLHTTLIHASGEWIGSAYPINPVKSDPQGIGSATSYARRYSLMALVGLAAEDDDGEAAQGRTQPKAVEQPKANPIGAAFKAATARGAAKVDLLAAASEACGYAVHGASDIKEVDIGKVIAAWEKLP